MSVNRVRYAHQLLDDAAGFLCAQNPVAADYLGQAPVLLALAARTFGSHLTYGEADRFCALIATGPKLRDVLASYGAPTPMRKIAASALRINDHVILDRLMRLDPSTLSQVIPIDSQRVWLDGIAKWMRLMPADKRARASFSVEWIARRLCEDMSRYEMVSPLVDAVKRGRLSINSRWSWARAMEEVLAWHRRLNDERQMAYALHQAEIAKTFDDVICNAPLPDSANLDGYRFVVLRTVRKLREEGQAMRHCVASYASDVKKGKSAIVSVSCDGVNLATLEVGKNGTVEQLKSHCNQAPSVHVRAACEAYVLRHWRPEKAA